MEASTATLLVVGALVCAALLLRLRGRPLLYERPLPQRDTSLGKAHEGVHEAHVAGVAVADMAGTVALAALLAWLSDGSVTAWLVVVLLVSEAMHGAYGVPTATQRWLFAAAERR
jgi:hypothetical protein